MTNPIDLVKYGSMVEVDLTAVEDERFMEYLEGEAKRTIERAITIVEPMQWSVMDLMTAQSEGVREGRTRVFYWAYGIPKSDEPEPKK